MLMCRRKLLTNIFYRRHYPWVQVCRTVGSKKDVSSSFPDVYDSCTVERGWYEWWRQQGYFRPCGNKEVPSFSMVLPPPNVTGTLHLGHALTCVVQDVLCRWHRMLGHRVVWVPGSDHAGIATQMVVEKSLKARGSSKEALGREGFLQEVHKWKEEKGTKIFEQLQILGASLDWERKCFTMSKEHSHAVNVAFKELFSRNLIYRGNGLVNWSCFLQSAISDIEVEHLVVEKRSRIQVPGYDKPVEFGTIFDVAYKLEDSDEEIVVSTTRPETILGDVAVAVHPDDARYTYVIGKKLQHPFQSRTIPVIADRQVQPEFGTGAVKITPGHDFNDFVLGQRHGLPVLSVINKFGRISLQGSEFDNLPRFEARWKVLEALKVSNLFRGSRPHPMKVPICSRSGDVIEPLIKPQWFLRCHAMAERAMKSSENGEINFHPPLYHNVWNNWLKNIKDWCLSRQLWWGHRVPMYLCSLESGAETWICALTVEEARQEAANYFKVTPSKIYIRQDEDVLDTWFSSAIIPFANFGWPKKADDLDSFYPLTLMETGHDILFFWVARMVWLGEELTGKLPFKDVLLHGMICDAHGRKMSKSLGNIIDPLFVITGVSQRDLQNNVQKSNRSGQITHAELNKALEGIKKDFPEGIPKCGTDALRFGLCFYDVKSQQINLDMVLMKNSSAFCNKMWQATRYLILAHQRLQESEMSTCAHIVFKSSMLNSRPENAWILSKCAIAVQCMNECLETKEFHLAARAIRQFMYSNLCDVYLEATKPVLSDCSHPDFVQTLVTLQTSLITGLKLLHPIMPFITEELYNRIPLLEGEVRRESIMIDMYPKMDTEWEQFIDESLMAEMDLALEIVSEIRNLKKSLHLARSSKPMITICNPEHEMNEKLCMLVELMQVLAPTGPINITGMKDYESFEVDNNAMASVRGSLKIVMHCEGFLNVDNEIERHSQSLARVKKNIEKMHLRHKKRAVPSEIEKENLLVLMQSAQQLEEQLKVLHRSKVT